MATIRPAAGLLVEALKQAGLKRLFSLSGNQVLSIYDACLDFGLDLIHVRHEAAAVHMADAWGRLTETPGVALVSAGPGHANTLSALYVAAAAESPLVLLSGNCAQPDLGRGGFQEMAQRQMVGPAVKAAWNVTDPNRLGGEIKKALLIACQGRPGPVQVNLPADVLESRIESPCHGTSSPVGSRTQPQLLSETLAAQILARLASSRTPLVLVGPALMRSRGRETMRRLAEATQLAIIGMESPRGTSDPSLGAFGEVLAEADTVLLLGKKLDFTLAFGSQKAFNPACHFLQIDPDPAVLEQTVSVLEEPCCLEYSAQADTIPAAEQLIRIAKEMVWSSGRWPEEVSSAIRYRPQKWRDLKSPEEGPLHPAELCRYLQPWLEGPAVLISEGGEFGQWAQACLDGEPRVINGPSGAIGGSIPFAIAARLAFPTARVVATLGDGAFGFHAMEFDTAVRYQLPFVAVVGNDSCWNSEKQIQLRRYGPHRLVGCDLLPTRYDRLVEALGGHGEFVCSPAQLPAALKRSFESAQPACVNVITEPVAGPADLP